jgi:D-alanyl-D-alanine carboxypeptidase/D-alanyl-D-alanine-endopeptidase (penicillin-binding protein 4)
MKVLIFLLTCCFSVLNLMIFSQNPVQHALNDFVAFAEFKNASVSFKAIDLASHEVIAKFNEDVTLPVASTTKLFTTSAAIELLGPDYRPETKVYLQGKIDANGKLHGNIWIRGGGDVTLGSRYFQNAGNERAFMAIWKDTLIKLGIKAVSGSVIADGSDFGYEGVPGGWSWNDIGNYYGAGPSGICIYDNMLTFRFKSSAVVGGPTTFLSTYPVIPNLIFHNDISSEKVSGDKAFIFGAPFALDRYGSGAIPINQPTFEVKGSLPDPEYQLAYEFTEFLRSAGIVVSGEAKSVRKNELQHTTKYTDDFQLVYVHQGASVREIAKITNLKSINLFAEGLVCLIGYHLTGKGTTTQGLRQIEKYLNKSVSFSGLFLEDGSGLSRTNGISATHFCSLLQLEAESANYAIFSATLPVAGKNGTVATLCKGQPGEGRIMAKSGTMNRVKSYAGYVNSKSGKRLAFAFTVSNFNSSSHAVVEKMEKVLNALAVY